MSLPNPTEANELADAGEELDPTIWLSPEESWRIFDQEAREIAGVSGEEFIRKVRAGEYHDIPDEPEYWDLIFLVQAVGPVRHG
jgi:hypothetical protein